MSRDHFNLDGRIALVAGASRGIGEAIARRLAEYGAHVLVTSRRVEGCWALSVPMGWRQGCCCCRWPRLPCGRSQAMPTPT